MHRPLAAGFAVVAVLLTGCDGSPDPAAAPASASDDVDGFCAEAQAVFSDADSAFDSVRDPAELPGLLQRTTEALRSVDAPAEIEGSWNSFAEAIGQLSDSAQRLDLSTPQGQDEFTQQYDAVLAATSGAQDDVDRYVTAHCPAAPGSPSS